MKNATTLLVALASTVLAGLSFAGPPTAQEDRAATIGNLMQDWQAKILAFNLPVEDAKNWSRRNMAKFGALSADRLALAQRAGTLAELELAFIEAPVGDGSRLDVLMANKRGDISMLSSGAKLSPATSPSSYAGLVFTALSPCRILDSRISQGGTGPWTASSINLIKIGPYTTAGGGYASGPGAQGGSATSCGLDTLAGPGQVAMIMAAVSTVSQAGAGYLTFFSNGAPNPGLTSVSQWYQPGYVQTSFVVIPTDLVGTVAAQGFTSASTDLIIDIVGYFAPEVTDGNISLVNSTPTTGNILKGGNRFIHNFGNSNTFIGSSAGNFAMTGSGNTGSGVFALYANGVGQYNTATGAVALGNNTGGSNNTAIGYSALINNSNGNSNTASGSNALANNTTGFSNTAGGYSALYFNTTGSYNTASGDTSLPANSTGIANTAIGYSALYGNTTGGFNIALGNYAGSNLTTGNYNIDIGNQGVAAEGNTIRIGDGNQVRTFISGIRGVTTAFAAIPVLIDSNGQLGTASSSRRFKDDITDMDAASSALMKLRPVTFHYKTDKNPSGRTLQYGLIAEEVAEVYPGLVAHSADGQVETVMYQYLPSMLLNEYQKQQSTIDKQATEIARQRLVIVELGQARQLQTAEIAGLKAAVAKMAVAMDQLQRVGTVTAGLELK
jgi:hypothetical protein